MLTGRQIREARTLLGINRSILAHKIGRMTTRVIIRAEENEDEPTLSAEQDEAVRQTLDRLGVEVGPHGVKLRARDIEVSKAVTGLGYLPVRDHS